ncbi:helix-turn-helix domain-containing protein [Demequina muriae]|uniref:Helix-turn-helix transcriptional regulator n=1 Tax=Demequina muriae TaxID=3051664 RepID=A0ABT8GK24_9MICO|nr:helix-turn-helix transcriptional regulator [Demequina sp. EGI L300058]MDN4481785.1 helix-turn-helix transcriptional regulator [Demequina sp. EGI L300058]
MPATPAPTAPAHEAYARREWLAAAQHFESSATTGTLTADDVTAWSRAAWWLGRPDEALTLAERAYGQLRDAGREEDAIATALRIALVRATRGDVTVGAAWWRRAQGLLRDRPDGPLHAYSTYLDTSLGLTTDGSTWSPSSVARLAELSRSVRSPEVEILSQVVSGMAAIATGDMARGFELLDEAMLGVVTDELEPEWGGDVLCTTIHACHELADLRRMSDWTRSTEAWAARFGSDAVYAGVCRVHRLELRSIEGQWPAVEDDLVRECAALEDGNAWIAGEGWYQLGELKRHQGDIAAAREAYGRARSCGIDPVPGEALLVLEEGAPGRALSMVKYALEGRSPLARVRLLRPGTEIALAAADLAIAHVWAEELRGAARRWTSPGFAAWADAADGMIALRDGRGDVAAAFFSAAVDYHHRHRQRCEHARALAWLAASYDASGNADAADHARDMAAEQFRTLGALARVTVDVGGTPDTGPLTAREAEVLAAVAQGASNREVAERLFISDKTVGRHLANIYVKLDVGTRTAAAAWWRDGAGARARE